MNVTTIASTARLTQTTAEVADGIIGWVKRRIRIRHDAQRCLKLLGLDRDSEYTFRSGQQHPLMPLGTPHPDDAEACCCIMAPKLSFPIDRIMISNELYSPLSDDIIAVGSPEAEVMTQIIFGYDRNDVGGLTYAGDTLDLPYRWLEDPLEVDSKYLRQSSSGDMVQRPNWPIISNVEMRSRRLYPKVKRDGTLRSDYLLITRVPNYLGDGLGLGHYYVSIAGTHGVGTRSIDLFMKDHKLLAEVWSRLGDPLECDSFQILCRADRIQTIAGRSVARSLRLLDVQLIDSYDARWNSAKSSASRRLRANMIGK